MDKDLRKMDPEKAKELVTTMIVDRTIDILAMKTLAQSALKLVQHHKKSVLAELTERHEKVANEIQTQFMNFMMMSEDKDAKEILYEHFKHMANNQTVDSLQYIADTMLYKAATNEHDLMLFLHGIKIADLPYDKEAMTLTFNKAKHNQYVHTWCLINIHLYEDKTDPNSRTVMIDYPLYFYLPDDNLPTKARLEQSSREQDEPDTDESSPEINININ